MNNEITLESLQGQFVLTGVDFYEEDAIDAFRRNASVCRFQLNCVTFCATEDPEDGYRSSMREVRVSDEPMLNSFQPVSVVCVYRDKPLKPLLDEYYTKCDLLEIINCDNGKTILTVGTDNCDDYYPCFVANFKPENIGEYK